MTHFEKHRGGLEKKYSRSLYSEMTACEGNYQIVELIATLMQRLMEKENSN